MKSHIDNLEKGMNPHLLEVLMKILSLSQITDQCVIRSDYYFIFILFYCYWYHVTQVSCYLQSLNIVLQRFLKSSVGNLPVGGERESQSQSQTAMQCHRREPCY